MFLDCLSVCITYIGGVGPCLGLDQMLRIQFITVLIQVTIDDANRSIFL